MLNLLFGSHPLVVFKQCLMHLVLISMVECEAMSFRDHPLLFIQVLWTFIYILVGIAARSGAAGTKCVAHFL